jgi:hypothetical protein
MRFNFLFSIYRIVHAVSFDDCEECVPFKSIGSAITKLLTYKLTKNKHWSKSRFAAKL